MSLLISTELAEFTVSGELSAGLFFEERPIIRSKMPMATIPDPELASRTA
jgi:hypothetical protein